MEENKTEMDLITLIGQRLVGGFPGTELNEEFIELVKKYKVGNVILFRHNIESGTQLRALCQSIQELIKSETGQPAFITIDQEGGVVTRLPSDSCNVPGAMAIAATCDPNNAKTAAKITTAELRALGINFNLAPVLDINNNSANPVIGVRSYGDTPETVETFGCAAIDAYIREGIPVAVKHFPGHGNTAVDSHIGLPVIDKSLEEFEELELRPFKAAIAKGVPAVMSSHILFPQLEPTGVPCTMSKKIVTGLLKEKLGFKGLVVSDCMEMDAIKNHFGTARGAVEAMVAGVDLIIVSHTISVMEEVVEAVYQAVSDGKLSIGQMEESARKIVAMKEKYNISGYPIGNYGNANAWTQSEIIRRKSITLTQGELISVGKSPLFTGCADFRATQASNRENNDFSFPGYMARKLGGRGIVTEKNPGEAEINEVVEAARISDTIFVCTYNAHLMPGQMALVRALADLNILMTVTALRNPYDLSGLPSNVTGIAAWDYTEMTLEILFDIYKGNYVPTGCMPVAL